MPDRPRMFGTDGVRGLANGELTAELAMRLAAAAAVELPGRRSGAAGSGSTRRPLAVLGRGYAIVEGDDGRVRADARQPARQYRHI